MRGRAGGGRAGPAAATAALRLTWLDALVFAAVAGFVAFIGYRVGDVLNYHWHWSRILDYLVRWDERRSVWVANLLLQGFFTTVRLAVWGIFWAATLGLVMGICR